jgi:ectoine hydroxylase-related dioxygenase (phytanoyl-CoA dioxygenase family)
MQTVANEITRTGYSIVENVLTSDFVAKAKRALESAIEKEAQYHQSRNYSDYGMVMLCSLYDQIFIDLFDQDKLMEPFNSVLGNGCIVYAYTSSSIPPNGTNYSTRIHVDCPRIIPGYITNMGATILLDDFSEQNGATYFLPDSYLMMQPPEEKYFFANARRLIAKAGSVWFFNARIWHAGGVNRTNQWRHALTINMVRPWMKQRIDIPRSMSHMDLSNVSENALQKLGFFSQVPANYDEYYVPMQQRKYRQKPE